MCPLAQIGNRPASDLSPGHRPVRSHSRKRRTQRQDTTMKILANILGCAAIAFASLGAWADAERGTPAEAEALVKKAVAYYQKNGREKALDDFSKSPGPFVDRDLYVTVLAMNGDSLAHINPKQRGKNMIDFRDTDGKFAIK